jgi:hypothetical protein
MKKFWNFVLLLAFPLSMSAAGTFFVDSVRAGVPGTPLGWLTAGSLAAACLFAYIIYRRRNSILHVGLSIGQVSKKKSFRRIVVMALSDLNGGRHLSDEKKAEERQELLRNAKAWEEEASRAGTSEEESVLDRFCKASLPYPFPWQQNMRLLRHFYDAAPSGTERLVAVVLTSDASSAQFQTFRDMAAAMCKQHGRHAGKNILLDIREGCASVAFNGASAPQDVRDAVAKAIEQAERNEHALAGSKGVRDICIDVTSGTKTYSLAAAALAMNKGVYCSYVDTNDKCDVHVFDLNPDVMPEKDF